LIKPLVERIDNEIDEVTLQASKKDKSKEDYRTLIGSLDILIRNKHMLSGGITSLNVFVLPSELIESNNITTSNVNESKGLIEPHNNT